MGTARKPAVIAAVVLALLIIFQVLLAAGLPMGRAAWGGEHRVLPANLRIGSLLAIVILGFAVFVVLASAGLIATGSRSRAVRVIAWIFAGYFCLNILMNLVSRSPPERYIMTPVATVVAVCFILVARSQTAGGHPGDEGRGNAGDGSDSDNGTGTNTGSN
ncbi:MAG: hypothetical protein PVJ42_01265 [bacterium]